MGGTSQEEDSIPDYLEAYPEIIDGFSTLLVRVPEEISKKLKPAEKLEVYFSSFVFKHPTHSDSIRLKFFYKKALSEAKNSGIMPQKELIDSAISRGWWSEEREAAIKVSRNFVDRMSATKVKTPLASQRKEIEKIIQEEGEKLNQEELERNSFIVDSAETFASKKIDEFYLKNLTFSDASFSTPLFIEDEIEYFNEFTFYYLTSLIFEKIAKFSMKKIQTLSASMFFQDILRSCPDDSAFEFYGKHAAFLSTYQSNLFSFGNYYKKCLKNTPDKIPNDVMENPEALISWFSSSSRGDKVKKSLDKTPNSKKTKGERTGRISSVVGATDEDYKDLGLNKAASNAKKKDLLDLAKESGGTADMSKLVNSI